jgi:hypothetical protein
MAKSISLVTEDQLVAAVLKRARNAQRMAMAYFAQFTTDTYPDPDETERRSQIIRTAWHLPVEAALLETASPPAYQRIAARAKQLSRLGMSNVQIARALAVTDKTVGKAVKWGRGALSTR